MSNGLWSRDGDCSESATGKLGCTPPHKRVVLELHDSGVVMDVVAKQQLETTYSLRPTPQLRLDLELTSVAQMRQVLFQMVTEPQEICDVRADSNLCCPTRTWQESTKD